MTLQTTFAMALAFTCAAASAQGIDGPLSLSPASSLQYARSPEPETVPAAVLPNGAEGDLPVVQLASPLRVPDTIDLTAEPDDLIELLRNGFSMSNINNDLVLYHQQWYMSHPDSLRRMVERSRPYLHYIIAELNKRGMPSELALLPMVESAYNPMAYSRSHASGLWQFIPSTGKNYKLEQNWWTDQRRDIVASTTAALDYLQTIYEMHGDWQLALASYNWGEGAVGRAIAKNKTKGLPSDYLSLTMPGETKNYVPKLQALKNIFSNPKLIADLGLQPVPNRPYFSTFAQPANIDVKLAAKLAEMPVQDFVALNPAHNQPVIRGETPLVIPTDKLDTFKNNLEIHQGNDKPLSSWQAYTFRAGDKLEKVAPRFGMTVANLKAVNGINGRIKVAPGATLLVAGNDYDGTLDTAAAAPPEQLRLPDADPAPATTAGHTHTVRKGETLDTVAKHYGIALAELKRLNHLKTSRLAPGTKLALASPSKAPAKADENPAGRVLARIDVKSGKSEVRQIKLAKQVKKTPKLTRYTIRRGDTLASIARHFNVEKDELLRWNRVSPNTLQPGQMLTIQLAQND
jgi:membrane-bound lytic murein transglycosylase D